MSDSDRLVQCRWPDLPPRFDLALRDAVAFVFGQLDPIGVVATGTIVRGTAHESSDLDICVIHRAPFRQRIQRFSLGVPTEIFVNPPATIRRYFRQEHDDARPIFAHMLATGVVVWASDAIVETLRDEARHWLGRDDEIADDWLTHRRYTIASQLEDALDVIDADEATGRMLLATAVAGMIELECRRRTGRVPRGKDLLRTLATADAELGRLAREFYSASGVGEQRGLAESIADRTLMTRGFFEWDSGPETVADA